MLPIQPDTQDPSRPEISPDAVAYHHRKWSRDGSYERVWQGSILTIIDDLDLSVLNQDGSHAIAKKGGESVSYQRRKLAKTTYILPITKHNGYLIASTELVACHHNDAWQLKAHLQAAIKQMKQLGLKPNFMFIRKLLAISNSNEVF